MQLFDNGHYLVVRTYTFETIGSYLYHRDQVLDMLLDASCWFVVEPRPDGKTAFTVKDEVGPMRVMRAAESEGWLVQES